MYPIFMGALFGVILYDTEGLIIGSGIGCNVGIMVNNYKKCYPKHMGDQITSMDCVLV